MTNELITSTTEDAIGIVKFARVEARNALSDAMVKALDSALTRFDADPAIKVVLLTAEGPHFAAGTDVREMRPLTVTDVVTRNFSGCSEYLPVMRKPVVVAVEGYAFGGGCELVEMCDIVIASETAKFAHPEITVGTLSGCGGTQRLPRVVGKHWALDVLLTGRVLTALEAMQCGLVSRVVAADRLHEEGLGIARRIAALSGPVVQMIKATVLQGLDGSLTSGLALERRQFHLSFALDDRAEGMTAFVEKRQPAFRDR
jgi:enoyl-CoA hydratase